ncbi:thioredoxin domain-containing protein [Candidatus Parcubacteria bacterium]|nr:thioredoxin domain-containing protein [Candidatus Parcubacteria bacterium]
MRHVRYYYLFGAIIGLGLSAYALRPWRAQSEPPATLLAMAVNGRDQKRGSNQAPTTVLMYGDFSCASCREYWLALNRLHQESPATLTLVYRHYLFDSTKPASRAAAVGAEAAGAQGKFWEYAGLLYDRQSEWTNAHRIETVLTNYASELNLNTARFQRDFNDPSIRKKVNDDLRSAKKSNVRTVPALFVNGRGVETPLAPANLKYLVAK